MNRTEKEDLVSELKTRVEEASLIVVTRQSGLNVTEATTLRREMRAAGANYKVYKNTLAEIAVRGTKAECLTSYFTGPTALAFSKDPIAAAKIAVAYAKKNDKISVLGGVMDGNHLNAAEVSALATMPSLDELRGKLVGLIQAPATKIARLAKEPGTCIARVLQAKASA